MIKDIKHYGVYNEGCAKIAAMRAASSDMLIHEPAEATITEAGRNTRSWSRNPC